MLASTPAPPHYGAGFPGISNTQLMREFCCQFVLLSLWITVFVTNFAGSFEASHFIIRGLLPVFPTCFGLLSFFSDKIN